MDFKTYWKEIGKALYEIITAIPIAIKDFIKSLAEEMYN